MAISRACKCCTIILTSNESGKCDVCYRLQKHKQELDEKRVDGMRFGAPSRTRCPSTGRVQHLYMESDNGGEEIFLTRLNEAIDAGPESIKAIRVELSDGRELSLVFPVGESQDEN
jgi:hypothetical protein